MKKFVRLFICLLIGISFLTFLTFSNLENISVAESEQKTNVVVPNQPELKSELEPTSTSEPQTALSKSATKIARDANPVEITEPLPVITLRFSDIDSLLNIARKIAGIAGVSETQFDKAINFVADNGDDGTGEQKSVGVIGSSLAGFLTDEVSKTEPIGFVIRTNGKEFIDPLFILPIKDLAKFAIPNFPFLQIEKIVDDKFSIKINLPSIIPQQNTTINLIGYQKDGYAVIVQETSQSPIPANPKDYFDGLEKYTIAMRVDFSNISYDAIVKLSAPLVAIMAMQPPEVGKQFQRNIEALKFYFDEFKTVDYGILIDPKTLDVELAYNIVPSTTSKIVSKFNVILKDRKTIFSGFKTSKTPVIKLNQANVNVLEKITLPDYFVTTVREQNNSLLDRLLKQIEKYVKNEDEIKYVHDAINSLKKLVDLSIPQVEGDQAIILDVEGTFLAASIFDDTAEIEKLFDSVFGFIRAKYSKELGLQKFDDLINKNLKRNYVIVSDYRISRFTIPLDIVFETYPIEALSKFKNKSYTFFVAIKDNAAIAVAGGFDADATETVLKTALESTSKSVPITQPLIQIDLQALGQILKGIDFENENTNKENVTASVLKNLVDLLIAAGDNAKITFSDKLNGSTYSVSTKIDGEIIRIIVKLLVLYSKNGNNTE